MEMTFVICLCACTTGSTHCFDCEAGKYTTASIFVHSGGTEATTEHNMTFAQDTLCDILIVGGGGGGGQGRYENGGGGGGGIVYMVDKLFVSGTYKILVGNGGNAVNTGASSSIQNDIAIVSFDGILLVGKGGGGANG